MMQVDTTGLALQEGKAVAAAASRHMLGELGWVCRLCSARMLLWPRGRPQSCAVLVSLLGAKPRYYWVPSRVTSPECSVVESSSWLDGLLTSRCVPALLLLLRLLCVCRRESAVCAVQPALQGHGSTSSGWVQLATLLEPQLCSALAASTCALEGQLGRHTHTHTHEARKDALAAGRACTASPLAFA